MPVQRSSLKTTADNRLPVGETEEWLSLLQLSMLILNCEPLKVHDKVQPYHLNFF